MKRYLCINNYRSESVKSTGRKSYIAFEAGEVYPEIESLDHSYTELIDELGTAHIITKELMVNFKELDQEYPLPADPHGTYWDHDSHEYKLLEPPPGCSRTGLVICIAVFLTVLALIFFR